jgi:hypothetical protein
MDGLCHWLRIEDSKYESYLVSFDMSNEVFFTTNIPSDNDDSVDEGCSWRHLTVLNGSIALITYHAHMAATFNISILGEFRVKNHGPNFSVLSCLTMSNHLKWKMANYSS